MIAQQQPLGPSPRRLENAVLFAAAGDARPTIARGDARGALDWGYLARAAERQGIAPLLHAWLDRRPDLAASREASARLHSAYWTTHFHNRVLLRELVAVLRAAAVRGVPVMPLKGALLAPHYYAAPALRPMSDLDLLVPPAHVEALASVLRDLGYTEAPEPPNVLDERVRDPLHRERVFTAEKERLPILIEYRAEPLDPAVWRLTELDPALSAALGRHAARMWSRGRQATLDDAPFARPAPEDLLLHVASHLTTRHNDFRLLWLRDIRAIAAAHADEFDWDDFAAEARALGLAAPVFASLEATHRWLGAPLPLRRVERALFGAGRRRLSLQPVERRLLSRRVRALGRADLAAPPPPERWLKMAALLRLRGPRPYLRALRWTLAPSRAYMRGWRGDPSVGGNAGYAAALALRLGLTLLHLLAAAGRRLALPILPALAERLVQRIYRATRLQPFAAHAPGRPDYTSIGPATADDTRAMLHGPGERG